MNKPEWKALAIGVEKSTVGLSLPLVHLKVWHEEGWSFSVCDRGQYKQLKSGRGLSSEKDAKRAAIAAAGDLLDEQKELLRSMIRPDS